MPSSTLLRQVRSFLAAEGILSYSSHQWGHAGIRHGWTACDDGARVRVTILADKGSGWTVRQLQAHVSDALQRRGVTVERDHEHPHDILVTGVKP